jgi:Mg-chelatase subunit ChlD
MRRLLPLLAVAVAAALASVASGAESDGLRLVEAGKSRFPERNYVLALPRRTPLSIGQVHVSENGGDVERLSVVPAGAAGRKGFGTLLLIDASESMTGAPIEGAMSAARAFAGRRNRNQQLGVMTFNSETDVLVPFSTDGAEIAAALTRTPKLALGTRIYDAVDNAISLIDRAGLKVGTIVLPSDGDDVGSKLDPAAVVDRVKSSKVRIFSVGLRSGAFQTSSLEALASASGGTFTEATSSAALAGIYDALGFRLANEYLLSWLSPAKADRRVDVRVSVDGYGAPATAAYRTPPLERTVVPPFERSYADRILQSGLTMLALVVLVMALVLFALRAVFRKPGETLQLRLSQYVTLSSEERERRAELRRLLGQRSRTDRDAPRFRWWQRFVEDVELADISMTPGRIAVWTAAGGLAVGLLFTLVIGSPIGLLFGLVAPLAARTIVSAKLQHLVVGQRLVGFHRSSSCSGSGPRIFSPRASAGKP